MPTLHPLFLFPLRVPGPQIAKAIHGFVGDSSNQSSFSVIVHESSRLQHRHAVFVRLSRPANLGFLESHIQFVMFVCGPIREVVSSPFSCLGERFLLCVYRIPRPSLNVVFFLLVPCPP